MTPVLLQIGLSLGLGLLVGLQREWRSDGLVGIRSFALITLFGTLCALLVEPVGQWVLAAGLLSLAAMLVLEGKMRQKSEERPTPISEIAALVMFVVGALLVLYRMDIAIVSAGLVAVLLQLKGPLHAFAARINEAEIRSIIRLALIALIILPLLPDRSYGPLEVLNPFRIWLMVVLIAGISLVSYLVHKFVGTRAGTFLTGVLGGLISSTATTVAYARRTRQKTASNWSSALVIQIASTVVFLRVLFEVGVLATSTLPLLAPPLLAMAAWMGLILWLCTRFRPADKESTVEPSDPSNLWAAIGFGFLYALVLVGVAVAKKHYGASGLYLISILSGLTDVDAITLSTAQMVHTQQIDVGTGWRMILVGAMSNLAFKGLAVAVLGTRRLSGFVALLFAASLTGGALILWLWPA